MLLLIFIIEFHEGGYLSQRFCLITFYSLCIVPAFTSVVLDSHVFDFCILLRQHSKTPHLNPISIYDIRSMPARWCRDHNICEIEADTAKKMLDIQRFLNSQIPASTHSCIKLSTSPPIPRPSCGAIPNLSSSCKLGSTPSMLSSRRTGQLLDLRAQQFLVGAITNLQERMLQTDKLHSIYLPG